MALGQSRLLLGLFLLLFLSPQLMAEERVNIWVLGAGSIHSAFEIGAVRVFFEETGRGPDIVVGTSGGSINAALIGQGFQFSRFEVNGIAGAEKEWRRIRGNRDFYKEEDWYAQVSEAAKGPISNLLSSEGAFTDVWWLLEHRKELTDAIKTVTSGQSKALYNLSPVIYRLRAYNILGNGVTRPRLLISTVDLESLDLRWIDGGGTVYDENFKKLPGPLMAVRDAVIASASIPVIFPPTAYNGRLYVDGGVRQFVPTWAGVHAAREMYPDRPASVYLVTPRPQRADPVKSASDMTILDIMGRTLEALVSETTERAISPYPDGWGVPVHAVRPRLTFPSSLNADPGLIALYIDYGYMKAADELRLNGSTRETASKLTDEIMSLRLDIWSKEDRFLKNTPGGHLNYWDQSSLDEIRRLKQRVQARTLQRHDLDPHVGFPPTLTQKWWWDWEDHDWNGYPFTGATLPNGPGVDPWCGKTTSPSAAWPMCRAATKPPRVGWVPDSPRMLRIDVTPGTVRAQDPVQLSLAAVDSDSGAIQGGGSVYVGGTRYDLTGRMQITHAFHADMESSTIIAVAPGYPAASRIVTVGLIPVKTSVFLEQGGTPPPLGVPTVVTISARDDRSQSLKGKVLMKNPGQAVVEVPVGTPFKWIFRSAQEMILGHSVTIYTTGQVVVDSDYTNPQVEFGFPRSSRPPGEPIHIEPEPSEEVPTMSPKPPGP